MDFFETPEEVGGQLERARKKLRDFEESAPTEALIKRLRVRAPFHPALIARVAFLILAMIGGLTSVMLIVMALADAMPSALLDLDARVGPPLPVMSGVFAVCLGVAFLGASQAAMIFARESPLLPAEQREHDRLTGEIRRLEGQIALMERMRATPRGTRPRQVAPSNTAGDDGGVYDPYARVAGGETPASGGERQTPPSGGAHARRGGTPLGAPPRAGQPIGRRASEEGAPQRQGGPIGAPAAPVFRSATPTPAARNDSPPEPERDRPAARTSPVAPPSAAATSTMARHRSILASARVGTQPTPPTSGPGVRADRARTDVPPDEGDLLPEIVERRQTPLPARQTMTLPPTLAAQTPPTVAMRKKPAPVSVTPPPPGAGFEQRYTTHFPRWGAVDEPWLEEVLQKSEQLATTFPVQAHLLFSAEEHLPFTLVLEKATPAMAVRAMVSYVEFLANIPTPPRGRIILRSVPHLERSFHRNVEAALEPYFHDKVTVDRVGERIELGFGESDGNWDAVPYLPIAG